MPDYAARIANLKSEQAKLAQRQSELAAQRRDEIGRLAEKLGTLEADDDVLTGMFLELKSAMESDGSCLKQWRDAGGRFRCPSLNGRSDTPRMLRRMRTALIRIEACRARMSHEERKLDTRRKIAMGGLVIKAGLDHEDPAVLLGMLMSAARVLSSPNADEHPRGWRERGDSVFKGA